MLGKRRYGRPGTSDLLWRMAINFAVSSVVLLMVFALFGTGLAIGQLPLAPDIDARKLTWTLYMFILPGASISFSLLWFWLILTGRTPKGLNWGAAYVHGAILGLLCLPVGSLFSGLLLGDPMLAVLLAVVSFVMVPSIALSMAIFGLIMGGINGKMAQRWIETHRPPAE